MPSTILSRTSFCFRNVKTDVKGLSKINEQLIELSIKFNAEFYQLAHNKGLVGS